MNEGTLGSSVQLLRHLSSALLTSSVHWMLPSNALPTSQSLGSAGYLSEASQLAIEIAINIAPKV